MSQDLTTAVTRYFWGDNLAELSWEKHKKYIVQTLLEKGDIEALQWLATKTTRTELRQLLPSLKLSPKSMNYWNISLS